MNLDMTLFWNAPSVQEFWDPRRAEHGRCQKAQKRHPFKELTCHWKRSICWCRQHTVNWERWLKCNMHTTQQHWDYSISIIPKCCRDNVLLAEYTSSGSISRPEKICLAVKWSFRMLQAENKFCTLLHITKSPWFDLWNHQKSRAWSMQEF